MSKRHYQISDIYPMLRHPEKYTGDRPITMRSGWEISFCTKYLDINENILEWKSEVPIKYICGTDGREHRYFIDFVVLARNKQNELITLLIEIKPFNQTIEPTIPKRKTASYYKAVQTYIKNQSKWKAANNLVEGMQQKGQNIQFMLVTERDCPWFLK